MLKFTLIHNVEALWMGEDDLLGELQARISQPAYFGSQLFIGPPSLIQSSSKTA